MKLFLKLDTLVNPTLQSRPRAAEPKLHKNSVKLSDPH